MRRDRTVPDAIDTSKHPMEPTDLGPVHDPAACEPEREQLARGDQPELALGDGCYRVIDRGAQRRATRARDRRDRAALRFL
jgi:hypothetical protein